MMTEMINATVSDRAENGGCPADRTRFERRTEESEENTWSRGLTDEEFTLALHLVLRGADRSAS